MKIGTFTKTEDGVFEGRVETLTFTADLKFEPATEKPKDRSPDFRIISANTEAEVGAAWHEKSQRTGQPYLSVKIDDPAFAYPMWAALTRSENGEYSLNWSRPRPKSDPESANEEETL